MTDTQQQRNIDDLVLVDVSEDARDAARDRADARLNEELAEGGRVRRFAKSIWKGNIAKEYYRQKYIRHAHSEIEQSQDVLLHEEDREAVRRDAMVATIGRFQSEYDEAIHDDAGEQRETLSEDSEIGGAVKDLIRQYAGGQLNDETLNEEFTRTIAAYRESGGVDLKGSGVVQMSNMLEIARQVRSAVDHGESIDAVMREFSVISGEARTGVRSAAKYDKVEKLIDKVKSSRVGQLIPSTAIVAGVSIAASVARLGSTKAVYAAASTVSLGVGAGLLSGLRERKRVKDERVQHSREMAQGKEFDEGSRRREEMDTARYESVDASGMSAELLELIDPEVLDSGGNDAVQAALDALARTETLVKLSDQRDIDLISYSDVANVAQERFELDIARAEAKVALRQRLDADMRSSLGLDANADIDSIIEGQSVAFIESIDDDISAKDQAFNKLRRRRTRNAALAGAATGLAFGLIAQETLASFSGTRSGLVERLWNAENTPHSDGMQHNTVLNGLAGGDSLQSSQTVHHDPSSTYAKYDIGDQGKIRLPDDYKLIDNKDGTISIVDPNGDTTISSLSVHDDGSLPKDSRQMLRSHGIVLDNISKTVEKTEYVDINDFIGSQHDTTTHVTRELWYDNDTPKPVFDQNELGMSWGGDSNKGITGKGDFTFSVAGMQADGSYHEGESTNWAKQAESGDLKLAVSASKDTQAHVFMLDIKPNGEVIIPKDGPAGALFENQNGQAVFKGAYAETVQITGEQGGTTTIRPLATVVGENNPGQVPVTTEVKHPGYKITPAGYDTVEKTDVAEFTEVAPVIPVVSRRALERIRRRETMQSPYGALYGRMTPEVYEQAATDRSPRLREDPSARLNLAEELAWHDQLIRRNGSEEYVRDIENTIATTPDLASINDTTEAIVTIPVGALQESDNIYRTLSLYGQQDNPDSVNSTLVLLHVNWVDADRNDPENEKAKKIQKTLDEIERAKRDYPGLRVSVMESEWSKTKLEAGGYGDRLIGHVSQKMYDAAMMAVKKSVDEGRMSPDNDVLVIKNDADALGMDRKYLEKMINAFKNHPENDVFTGAVRMGAHRTRDLPGLGFVSQFWQISRIAAQRSTVNGYQDTFGVNAAVRMSTFAAVGGIGHYSDQKVSAPDDLAIGDRVNAARNASPVRAQSGQSGRRRKFGRRDGPKAGGYGIGVALSDRGSFNYHRHVVGADIDSDADRMEEVYIQGKSITDTWKKATGSNGEMIDRDSSLKKGQKEDLVNDSDAVVARIEKSISGLISEWVPDEKQFTAGLAFVTPGPQSYKIKRTSGGRREFTFTPEGRKWVVNRLRKNTREQFDGLGNRRMRSLYNDVSSSSKIRPKKTRSKMAGGVLKYA
jgi:hypothetical protein